MRFSWTGATADAAASHGGDDVLRSQPPQQSWLLERRAAAGDATCEVRKEPVHRIDAEMRKRPRLLPESRASKAAVESPGSERMPGVIGDVASTYGAGHEAADAAVGRRHRSEERRVGKECRSRWS